jgi:hypothetical protein
MTLSGSIERPRIIFAPWGWLETFAVVVVTRLDDAFAPDEVITWTTALWAANMIRQHRMINPDMASQPRGGNAFVERGDETLIGKALDEAEIHGATTCGESLGGYLTKRILLSDGIFGRNLTSHRPK